ncbi:GNAT family N-acetyltransferase [Clostridium oryzae]|uniref:Spermine/spermidine acetyltransferase n=1 Tax=Clostridium oryzae TaxID=1450648 RepID=A0A1V4ICH0_9CLOT|nr:GNAT family N-acetyltransferase [Clostridium oryzae]OPJ57646.1 spermine/spermidine acetyltransferase [Clostridium oryzae]
MGILLKEVDAQNWYDCVELKVAKHQREFVATNAFSLAQSKYESGCFPMCIYNDETMVGFVMFVIDNENESGQEEFWICRFMIDENFQGKGYGKASMAKIIEYIKSNFNHKKVYLSEVSENRRAKNLYRSFGFEFTGEIREEEEVMVLML